jgi:protein ImuA
MSRGQTIAELQTRLRELERARRSANGLPTECLLVTSGCSALDQLLPEGSFRRGTLVEWLAGYQTLDGDGTGGRRADNHGKGQQNAFSSRSAFNRGKAGGATTTGSSVTGSGAATLALFVAREACRAKDAGPLVIVDRGRQFYPPAAARVGIDLNRVALVRVNDRADEAWALDQALRCPGVGAVWHRGENLSQRSLRRFQLAAEISGGLGLFVRPETARTEPCWADVRLLVQPLVQSTGGRRLRVEVVHLRGGTAGKAVELELDDATGALRLASPVVSTAAARRTSSAG